MHLGAEDVDSWRTHSIRPEIFRTEVSAEQIRMVRESFGDRLHVGAGTVMTETQRKLATAAGAEYIISPNVNVEIIRATKAAGLLSIPGAFTPFEIITAYEAGTDFVKFLSG